VTDVNDGPPDVSVTGQAEDRERMGGATAPRRSRIASIDILRGVGVLGMLAVHIQLFASVSLARWNPTAYGDLAGINWWVWLVTYLLADGKFIAIFAMLFGAGIVLRDAGEPQRVFAGGLLHLRRTLALLILGLLHAYLVWYGDMLVPLALCGALVFVARALPSGRLIVVGCLLFAVASVLSWALTVSALQSNPAAVAEWRAQWLPHPATIAAEIAEYRGSWLEQMKHRVPAAFEIQTWDFRVRLVWQISGLMLMGMGLFKRGVFTASRAAGFYALMASVGVGTGVSLIGLGVRRSFEQGWDLVDFVMVSQQLNYWGDLLVALGWIGVVMLLCQRGWPLRPVEAVGRMALTNYLLQSAICTTIFYGHGFGLFGRVDRAGQLAIVIAIWAFEVFASSLWLRFFALGPAEWVWRWLIWGRRPRFARLPTAATA
jgi:uncharacterized protein